MSFPFEKEKEFYQPKPFDLKVANQLSFQWDPKKFRWDWYRWGDKILTRVINIATREEIIAGLPEDAHKQVDLLYGDLKESRTSPQRRFSL